MSLSVAQMREILQLGLDVPDAAVVDAYAASLDDAVDGAVIDQVLPLERVKQHVRPDRDDEDELLTDLIRVAVEAIESDTGHLFGSRTVTEHFKSFDAVKLRAWPILSIIGIGYHDGAGAAQVFDETLVRLSAARRPVRLVYPGGSWPYASASSDAVSVTVQAGYAAADVPMRLRQAALLMIGDLYEHRGEVTDAAKGMAAMSLSVDRLLAPFRILAV